MKVYELLNELKGTDSTAEQIASWMYDNKICPLDLDADILEIEEYPKSLYITASKICDTRKIEYCYMSCFTEFVNKEIADEEQISCQALHD